MARKFLGIDIGTGGTRAVLIDENGRVLGSATAEHKPISAPHRGWAEQQPDDWWAAACKAVPACLANAKATADEVESVGLTGQMHGLVMLDADGKVLRPALIWCDQRTDEECREITAKIGAKRVKKIMLPKDYVRYRLTGAHAIDVADASGTLILDVVNRRWSKEMMAASGLVEEMLPNVLESQEVSGKISADGAAASGLKVGVPVVAGAGDQAAGAVGMGIVRPGAVSATIGTSGVVFAATASPEFDPQGRIHTFCHAVPKRWHVMGVTQAAGFSLRWFRDQFGVSGDPSRDAYNRLQDEASHAPAGSDGVLWAPYLMGERTPHLDPNARAALVGLSSTHTRAHVVRAILEGVAYSLRDTLSIFADLKLPVESIRLGGGGARGGLWRQIQADVYGMPVDIVEAEEGPAYGAALLAGVGVGAWKTVDDACDAAVRVASRVQPNAASVAVMNKQYAAYRRLYPALREVYAGAA